MFAKAYRIAGGFTLPVVISSRSDTGECKSAIGACVVVNRDGWILTTAHLISEIRRQQESALQHSSFDDNIRQFEQDSVADKRYRRAPKVRTFRRPSKDSVRNHSVWWGRDGMQLHDIALMPATDLALGRLAPFDGGAVAQYPVFKKPGANYTPGRSLCKLGFPFHNITPSYDEERKAFVLPPGAVPPPLFPIEGLFTRVLVAPMPAVENDEPGKFIETSSPGLVGQSGGPIVDADGVVWAVQSHTRHYPLGFSPPVPGQEQGHGANGANGQGKSGKIGKEHQFLNVGLGIHTEPILQLLHSRGVEHQTVD